MDKVFQLDLLAKVPDSGKARILASASKYAGASLTVSPNKFLNLEMHPIHFAICLRYRLGASVHSEGEICPVCNDEVLDANGNHGVNCKKSGDMIGRHNAVRDYLAAQCRTAQLSPRTEVGDDNLRPGDVFLPAGQELDQQQLMCWWLIHLKRAQWPSQLRSKAPQQSKQLKKNIENMLHT